MKRVPRAFCMGPHTITVQKVTKTEMDALASEDGHGSCVGLCDYDNHRIYVLRVSKDFSKVRQLHAFWHEYFHMILYCVGRERLAFDESLVDLCGAMQLQAFTSAEF